MKKQGEPIDAVSRPGEPIEGAGMSERSRLLARAGVVGAGTFVSRLLGLARDVTFAALFDRDATDAWLVAFAIPNSLRMLLAEGVVSSAVVPILSEKLATEGEGAARLFFARVRGVSLLCLAGVTALGMVFARPLTELFAEGYRDRPGELERTVVLTRVVFPYIAFMGTAALGMAALNAKRRFAVAAFAPGLLNVALLGAAFTLPHWLTARGQDGVLALALGALVGGLLQVAAQWPALRSIGFADAPRFALDPDVKRVLRRVVTLAVGMGILSIELVVSRRFLSGLSPGSLSYFSFAARLCDFPQGIFVMALSTAALPSLSTLAAKGARGEFASTWAHGMGLGMFVSIPASAALVVLGGPIVVAVFQRGQFDAVAAHETARALFWQGGAIWTVAAVRQTIPAFYALGDTRTPVVVSAIDLGVFIVLAASLRGPMGHAGVSAAVACASAVQMVLLFIGLRWRLGTVRGADLVRSMARTLTATLAASVTGWGVSHLARAVMGTAARAVPGLLGMAAFVAAFVTVAWSMGAPELDEVLGAVQRRFGRKTRA